MVVYLGKKPVGVTKIVKQAVNKTKFGVSIDDILGNVDADGMYVAPTEPFVLNLSGVKKLGLKAMSYLFYQDTGIIGVVSKSLQIIENSGLQYTFSGCTGITNIDFSSLETVGISGMSNTFNGCSGITSADLSSVQIVGGSGMNSSFYNCSNLTNIKLGSLQSVDTSGLQSAFYNCKKLTKILLPSLTSVKDNSFGSSTYAYAFRDCTALAEIHFRADMQSTVEAMTGYANKWGATNASIIFDL